MTTAEAPVATARTLLPAECATCGKGTWYDIHTQQRAQAVCADCGVTGAAESASPEVPEPAPAPAAPLVQEILLGEIARSALNPRMDVPRTELEELAESIRQVGLLQPIVVRPLPPTDQPASAPTWGPAPRYEIVAGERRYQAAHIAGLDRIQALVRADLVGAQQVIAALAENLSRKDLNPLEEARGYEQLQALGLTQGEIGRRVGRSREAVVNALRLHRLPMDVQRRIRQGELSATHGLALLRLSEDPKRLCDLAARAVREQWSTDRLRAEVEQCLAPNTPPQGETATPAPPEAVPEAEPAVPEGAPGEGAVEWLTPEEIVQVETEVHAEQLEDRGIHPDQDPAQFAQVDAPAAVVPTARCGHCGWEHPTEMCNKRPHQLPPSPPCVEPQNGDWWADAHWTGGFHRLFQPEGGVWVTACNRRLEPFHLLVASDSGRQCWECRMVYRKEPEAPLATPALASEPTDAQLGYYAFVARVQVVARAETRDEARGLVEDVIPRELVPGIEECWLLGADALPTCRVCGCTDDAGCQTGCSWIAEGLCSSCAPEADATAQQPEPEPPSFEQRWNALTDAERREIVGLSAAVHPKPIADWSGFSSMARIALAEKLQARTVGASSDELADLELGVDAKGRRWQVWGNKQGTQYRFWGLSWFDEKRQEWRSEQYAPTYESRAAAIAAFQEKWAAPEEAAHA